MCDFSLKTHQLEDSYSFRKKNGKTCDCERFLYTHCCQLSKVKKKHCGITSFTLNDITQSMCASNAQLPNQSRRTHELSFLLSSSTPVLYFYALFEQDMKITIL